MTKDQAKRLLDPQMQDVIRAWPNVQWRKSTGSPWTSLALVEPSRGGLEAITDPQYEWRVKPEPRQPRRIWVNECAGELGTTACKSKEEAYKNQNLFDKRIACVEFVEVIKEGQ